MRVVDRHRTVHCYHCNAAVEVAASARSASCTRCSKWLMLDDLVVGGSALYPGGGHGPLVTCGRIVIEAGGRVTSRAVQAAEGVEIHGNVTANLSCQGGVFIAAGSTFRGTCRAGSLVVEEGAIVQGEFAIGDSREG